MPVFSLFNSLTTKDFTTALHCLNVARLSEKLCSELKLDDKTTKNIYYAGLLHDIGKLEISDEICTKKAVLSGNGQH